jgi:heme-degrading monooxygenase HmoA
MAPPKCNAMALVMVPLAPGKTEEALALFKDHEWGIKYTMSMKGAVSFDLGIETTEDGSETLIIFEYWREMNDYGAYVKTRRDEELMKDWNAVFSPCVVRAPTIKWFPLKASYSN